jgi:hypothetical protein
MRYQNRRWRSISIDDLGAINFNNIVNSESSLRYNNTSDTFIIEYDGACPLDIETCESASDPLTYLQAKSLMQTESWKDTTKAGDL